LAASCSRSAASHKSCIRRGKRTPVAMSAADGKFHPPRWCRTPKDPSMRRQELMFVREESNSSTQPVVAAEISEKPVYTIGRNEKADARLRGDLASRMHAAVLQDDEGSKFLVDLKSTHGTYLGAKRLVPHVPVKWETGTTASFGSGETAEVLVLGPEPGAESASDSSPAPDAKRRKQGTDEDIEVIPGSSNAVFDLYGGLPEATQTECAPKPEAPRKSDPPIPVEADPRKIIFLDIDGVLRPLHSRQDAFQHARTIAINGARVPLLGKTEAKAGIDFWPGAMRALRQIVAKTGARIVLSSDWRKSEELKDGVRAQFDEYRMPPLYDQTPDLDAAAPGVLKALHSSFREKRCKEIRKWLKAHPTIERWIAIDDVDLSMPDKEAHLAPENYVGIFLDASYELVRCIPTSGLTMELARIAICLLNGVEVTEMMVSEAYGGTHVAAQF